MASARLVVQNPFTGEDIIVLDVEVQTTVAKIKAMISKATGIPVEHQKLMLNDVVLANDFSILEQGTLHLIVDEWIECSLLYDPHECDYESKDNQTVEVALKVNARHSMEELREYLASTTGHEADTFDLYVQCPGLYAEKMVCGRVSDHVVAGSLILLFLKGY
jgi:Ubiquitin family